MVVGWVDKNQKIIIQDRHGDARHPILDQQQTISNLRGVRNGDVTTIEFSRPQRNGDSQDVMTDDVTCPYFVFPVKGGAYDTFTMKIQPHVEEPEISDVGVCITQCKGNAGEFWTLCKILPLKITLKYLQLRCRHLSYRRPPVLLATPDLPRPPRPQLTRTTKILTIQHLPHPEKRLLSLATLVKVPPELFLRSF